MAIMTFAKFYFNRLMLTLIFGIWASEPPGPGERLKRPDLIGLIDFDLVRHSQGTTYRLRLSLSLSNSPALVNDYWTVIDTTVTDGSKHFLALLG